MIPVIETERLTLRAPAARDLDAYTAYYTGPRTAFVGGAVDTAKAFNQFGSMIGHWHLRGFGRFVFCDKADDTPMGHAGPMQIDLSVPPELTWTIWDARYERQGYATEAARATRQFLFDATDHRSAIARVMPDNTASRAIAEKLGGRLDTTAEAPAWLPGSVTYMFHKDEVAA